MGVNRRTFLKLSGLVAAGAAAGGMAGPAAAGGSVPEGIPGVEHKAMLNDVSRCIGCLSCAVACKKANKLPGVFEYSPATGGETWTTVKFLEQDSEAPKKRINLKVQCMHCGQASCAAVCPTGAAHKRNDGITVIDQNVCIGCKYCVMACPFNVPGYSEETGTVRKCNLCESRLGEGNIPACAEACPAGAVEFGNYEELLAKAGARVDYLKANGNPDAVIYGQKELNGLKTLYVLPAAAKDSGLPGDPRMATGDSLTKWTAGLLTAGLLVTIPLRSVFNDIEGQDNTTDREKGGNKDD